MNVVEHRPPMRRIEIGSAPADRRRASEVTEAMSGVGPAERDRIWRLVEQSACGGAIVSPPAGAPAIVEEEHLPPTGGRFADEPIFLRSTR